MSPEIVKFNFRSWGPDGRFQILFKGIVFDTAQLDHAYMGDTAEGWKMRAGWERSLEHQVRQWLVKKPSKLVEIDKQHYRLPVMI